MTWTRLDWVSTSVRQSVSMATLDSSEVFHYSIPLIEETGDGAVEDTTTIDSDKLLLHGGEVLISKLNPRKSRVMVAKSHPQPTVCSSEFVVLRPGDRLDAEYLRWRLSANDVTQALSSQVRSATRSHQRVEPRAITKMWLDIPDLRDQRMIVEFLNSECRELDSMVHEHEHQDTLLAERRGVAVIDSVTGRHRLGERVSGIEWTGSLPAEWRQVQIRRVAELGSGHTPSRSRPELWRDCTIPWITTGEVSQIRTDVVEVLTETREYISELGVQESSAVVRPKGTVVLSRTASAGYSAIMGTEMATSQDFVTWTCGPELEPRYLLYCLRAMRADLLGRLAQGSTFKTIYMPDVRSIRIPLPPMSEQRAICDELSEVLAGIDALRAESDLQGSLLAERRQALITAAVTGQLEVA